jgi:type I restriction enzyme S subunit
MKQGWELKKLGEVVEVLDSLRKPITKKHRIEGEYPYYGATGILSYVHNYIFSEKLVLIGEDGAKWLSGDNTSFIANGKYWVNNHAHVIRPKRNIILDEWIVYFLNFSDLTPFITGMTVPKLNQEKMRSIELPIPPLPEQQQIVAILDEAFSAIDKAKANAEQNLKNAKELFESYLQGVFENPKNNWEVCNLETYIKLIDYRGRTPVKTESGVRLITAKNVKLGYLQLEPQEFIANSNYESWMSRGIPNFGDVIFTTEAPLANVAQIDTLDKVAFAQRIIVMQPNPLKLNQTFLKYMLLSNPIRNKILDKGTGATVLGIKSSLLKKVEIYFPSSIDEQQKIVEKLDVLSIETKKLEAIYQQKINDLEELKKSVLQKAFSGELKTEKVIL